MALSPRFYSLKPEQDYSNPKFSRIGNQLNERIVGMKCREAVVGAWCLCLYFRLLCLEIACAQIPFVCLAFVLVFSAPLS